MKERDTQVDVFHYDCFWMKGFKWTDFVFDSEKFPDPSVVSEPTEAPLSESSDVVPPKARDDDSSLSKDIADAAASPGRCTAPLPLESPDHSL